jgi:hypothetical protein
VTVPRAALALTALVLVAAVAGCDDDPDDAAGTTTTPAATTTSEASTSETTTTPGSIAGPASAAALCPTVQAWSDASVDAVNAFRIASRGLDPAQRRARYAQAFDEQVALETRLTDALDGLALPTDVRARIDTALGAVAATIEDNASQAAALPDTAYRFVAVSEGKLVTGTEKAKAIMFAALGELAQEPATGVPRGCGRRGALDLSPSATFPP